MWNELLAVCARIGIFWIASITSCLWFMGKFLGRRRSYVWAFSYLLAKGIIINILIQTVLYEFYQDESWWQILHFVMLTVFAVTTYVIYCLSFRGSFLKIGIAGMLAEANFCGLLGVTLTLLNFIEKRENLLDYAVAFHWIDFFGCPIIWGILYLEYLGVRRVLPLVQKYEPGKYRKLLWAIFLVYLFVSTAVMAFTSLFRQENLFSLYVLQILVACLFASVIIRMYLRYKRQILLSREFLLREQEMIRLHYSAVREQILKMEKEQALIKTQMTEICERSTKSSGQEIHRYLSELRKKYEEIRAEVYCADPMVDAVLYYMEKICRRNGVACEFSFRKYDRGNVLEEDVAELIFLVLNQSLKESLVSTEDENDGQKAIELKAAAVKNQLVVEFSCSSLRKRRRLERDAITYVTRYNGGILRQKKKSGYSLIMKMQRI